MNLINEFEIKYFQHKEFLQHYLIFFTNKKLTFINHVNKYNIKFFNIFYNFYFKNFIYLYAIREVIIKIIKYFESFKDRLSLNRL